MNGPNYWKPKGSMNRSKSATLISIISLVGGGDDGTCGRSKLRPKKALADMEVGCKEDSTDGTYSRQ
jgi:hypothetical protein